LATGVELELVGVAPAGGALAGAVLAGVSARGAAPVAVAGAFGADPAGAGGELLGADSESADFGSTSDIIWRKVPSSIGRSVLPSQVDPSGTLFWTVVAAASTWSTLASVEETGIAKPRGSFDRLATRSQLTSSPCALSCFCWLEVMALARRARGFFQLRASSYRTS